MFVALQRVKTGDWKFQNYDMNTSYLVSPVPSTLHMFFSFALFVFEPSCQDAHCRISSVKNVGVWMHGVCMRMHTLACLRTLRNEFTRLRACVLAHKNAFTCRHVVPCARIVG